MKARVCPKCGKHNLETAFNCLDCGATLSIKTLIDTNSGQFINIKPIAGYQELSSISPHFEADIVEIFKTINRDFEDVIWGCNITQLTRPGTGNFLFGYLIITSQQVIQVQFVPEFERKSFESIFSFAHNPLDFFIQNILGTLKQSKRSFLEVWPTSISRIPFIAVSSPQSPLTPIEKSSRNEAIYLLQDLTSCRLDSTGYRDIILISLTAKFQQGNEMTVTFYAPDEAEKAYKLIQRERSSSNKDLILEQW